MNVHSCKCGSDDIVYKYKDAKTGQKLYGEYENNIIVTEQDFLKRLEYQEHDKI